MLLPNVRQPKAQKACYSSVSSWPHAFYSLTVVPADAGAALFTSNVTFRCLIVAISELSMVLFDEYNDLADANSVQARNALLI